MHPLAALAAVAMLHRIHERFFDRHVNAEQIVRHPARTAQPL
jgi:hypothetical protein